MRYWITIFILIAVYLTTYAQNEAKTLLDKSTAKIKALPAVEIDFTLTMENKAEGIQEVHEGKAWMKGNLYKLHIMDVENYYDGKNIYTYMPEVKEVNLKNPSDEEEEMLSPTKIFDIHNTGFTQKLVSQEKGIAYIELYPLDEDKNFTKIGIQVKTADSSIEEVKSFGKDGNNLIIKIKNIKQPTPVPADSFFKFDTAAHPEVEVIDMR
ncbi:LolA family protein [Odoribacter laneus]|uniref:LolA family protein n=1 Tax=Odoribacter laneus TaxID=626933 RepID=UPI003AF9BDDD